MTLLIKQNDKIDIQKDKEMINYMLGNIFLDKMESFNFYKINNNFDIVIQTFDKNFGQALKKRIKKEIILKIRKNKNI